MNVIIVEDQTMLRESLANAIEREPDMHVVAQYSDAAAAVHPILAMKPDVVLMDVCTEHDSSGITAAGRIKDVDPSIKVVIITGMPEITFIEQAREAGVDSFVYKNVPINNLLEVIRSTANGYGVYPTKGGGESSLRDILNDEEIQILRLICETKSRAEIASELYMSEGTVKRRIGEILAKTGFERALDLAVYAVGEGFIVPHIK